MKKFIALLSVIIVSVGVVFGTILLLKDDEKFIIEETQLYVTVGDKFKLTLDHIKPKKSTKVTLEFPDELVDYDAEADEFTALAGGTAYINFKTTNTKYRNNSVTVYIGNGEILSPFYIKTAEDLMKIGAPSEYNKPNYFGLDKYYRIVNDIDLAGIEWQPIGIHQDINMGFDYSDVTENIGFIGELDGGGYTVKNAIIDPKNYDNHTKLNAGIFYNIGYFGRVVNVNFDNITINADDNMVLDYVGIVSGETRGEIERVSVNNSRIAVANAKAVGGVTGSLLTGAYGFVNPSEGQAEYSRTIAELDRVSANVTLGAGYMLNDEGAIVDKFTGVGGLVGGLVGKNVAGVIVYSYATGQAYVNNHTQAYGGLVGSNQIINYSAAPYAEPDSVKVNYKYQINGVRIKDTYAAVQLNRKLYSMESELVVGGLIGKHNDLYLYNNELNQELSHLRVHKVIGSYYDIDKVNNFEEVELRIVTTINQVFNEATGQLEDVITEEEELVQINNVQIDGIGQALLNNVITVYPNKDYFILGKTHQELTDKETFKSYMKTIVVVDENSEEGFREVEDQVENWLFGLVWKIEASVNSGMPYLTFAHVNVSNNVEIDTENVAINTAADLAKIKLDGHYVIISNINLANPSGEGLDTDPNGIWTPWKPIGTKNRPFVGSIQSAANVDEATGTYTYFSIYGLTVLNTEADYEFAGLFGVTTNENNGSIKNLVFKNARIKNAKNAGVLVGTNGFVLKNADGTKENKKGINIENITVIDSSVIATENVGGIAGINYGEIKTSVVENTKVTLVSEEEKTTAGGIVGLNSGTINEGIVREGTKISADSGSQVDVGGIAGRNVEGGEITRSVVRFAEVVSKKTVTETPVLNGEGKETGEVTKAESFVSGSYGGITGLNTGNINNSVVRAVISTSTKDSDNYVGGVAGRIEGRGTVNTVLVYSTVVTGYTAGGIAGEIENNRDGKPINISFNNDGLINEGGNEFSARYVGIEQQTIINGHIVGGLVGRLVNGIISDSYITKSVLKTTDGKDSFAGGIAGEVLHSVAEGLKVGIIQKVYNATEFEGNGKHYAVSKSEFLKDYLIKNIPLTNITFTRKAGYIVAYLFDDQVNGNAEKPASSNWFSDTLTSITNGLNSLVSWFPKYGKHAPSKTQELYTSTKFAEFNFNTNDWLFNGREYPRLKSLVDLEESITTFTLKTETSIDYKIEVVTSDVNAKVVSQDGKNYLTIPVIKGGNLEIKVTVVNKDNEKYSNYVIVYNNTANFPEENGTFTFKAVYENAEFKIMPYEDYIRNIS